MTDDRPRLLDLFCGAGGAAMGYHRAGFEVVGVDINPQPHYPFEFHQADALTYPLDGFDAIHASPPCQFASAASHVWNGRRARPEDRHPNLIPATRARLDAAGLPYVIENVPRARRWLVNPLTLCGSMFETRVYRHRLFECKPPIYFPPMGCNHSFAMPASKGAYHVLDADHPFITAVGHNFAAESGRRAMQIDWMTRDEMAQAIPPAYTEWIGRQLLASFGARGVTDHPLPIPPMEGEHCHDCGRTYGLMGWWRAPDDLWERVTLRKFGGLYCPDCFGKRARARGIELRWSVEEDR